MQNKKVNKVFAAISAVVMTAGVVGMNVPVINKTVIPVSTVNAEENSSNIVVDGIIYTLKNGYAVVSGINNISIKEINIPNSIENYPIKEISYKAFMNCTQIETVNIPSSVNEIGEKAFYGCNNLKQVNYGGTIKQWTTTVNRSKVFDTSIKFNVKCSDGTLEFADVSNFYVPTTIIGSYNYDYYMQKYNLPNPVSSTDGWTKVTKISDGELIYDIYTPTHQYDEKTGVLFGDDSGISWAVAVVNGAYDKNFGNIPSSISAFGGDDIYVIGIEDEAFKDNANAQVISISNYIDEIGDRAFYNCKNLRRINIEYSEKSGLKIGKDAFYQEATLNPNTKQKETALTRIDFNGYDCNSKKATWLSIYNDKTYDTDTGLKRYSFGDATPIIRCSDGDLDASVYAPEKVKITTTTTENTITTTTTTTTAVTTFDIIPSENPPITETLTDILTTNPSVFTRYGDVDCNESVNIADVVLLNKWIVGADKVSEQGQINAESFNDGAINSKDSSAILSALSGLIKLTDLPISEIPADK